MARSVTESMDTHGQKPRPTGITSSSWRPNGTQGGGGGLRQNNFIPGSPINDTASENRDPSGAQSPVMVAGKLTLEGSDRRKLIKEIRDEIKPLCGEIADYQIEQATVVIKQQIRKIENDV